MYNIRMNASVTYPCCIYTCVLFTTPVVLIIIILYNNYCNYHHNVNLMLLL